jgi:tRNA(fMet)-specific endonuclease VapC
VSLYVLDTDILSLFQRGHLVVCQRVAAHPLTDLAITVISVEEQLSGWYALLRSVARRDEVALAYQSLAESVPFLARFRVVGYSEKAMDEFDRLASLKLNIRKMDLRIAAIALEHGAIVATRNLRDFQRVPGLATEDWTV